MQRIGIYPGTFDPIHDGHVSFALESIKACRLDRVIFIPETMPRKKVSVSPVKKRLEDIRIKTNQYTELESRLLTSPQFTVASTLPEIQSLHRNAHLTLLVGSDVATSLNNWEGVDSLLIACDIAIGKRSHQSHVELERIIELLDSRHPSTVFTIVHTDYPSHTSSMFRNK